MIVSDKGTTSRPGKSSAHPRFGAEDLLVIAFLAQWLRKTSVGGKNIQTKKAVPTDQVVVGTKVISGKKNDLFLFYRFKEIWVSKMRVRGPIMKNNEIWNLNFSLLNLCDQYYQSAPQYLGKKRWHHFTKI